MPPTIDINLPRDHQPHFPEQCVACGAYTPDSRLRCAASVARFRNAIWPGGKVVVEAPACRQCVRSARIQRGLSWLASLGIIAAAIWIVHPWATANIAHAGMAKLVVAGIALLAVAPQVIAEMFFPPAFDIVPFDESIDYEFRDREYAIHFVACNADAASVRVNGEQLRTTQ